MQQLILRFLFFLVVVLSLNAALYSILPEGWQNIRLHTRQSEFESDYADSVTIVFIGSSRTMRTFNPIVIEQRLQEFGHDHNVYNLGYPGVRFLEQNYLIDKLEDVDMPHLEYLVVELQTALELSERNRFTARSNYMFDWEHLGQYINLVRHKAVQSPVKMQMSVTAFMSFIEDLFSIGYIHDVSTFYRQKRTSADSNLQGHEPLALENGLPVDDHLNGRFSELQRDTMSIMNSARRVATLFDKGQPEVRNAELLALLKRQIAHWEEKNVHLVFVTVPGRSVGAVSVAVCKTLPDSSIINLGNFETLPGLTEYRYWFDKGHLNEQGSIILSGMFADSLNQLAPEY